MKLTKKLKTVLGRVLIDSLDEYGCNECKYAKKGKHEQPCMYCRGWESWEISKDCAESIVVKILEKAGL